MAMIAVNKIVVTGNVRIIPGVADISKVTFEDLPQDEQDEIKELAGTIERDGLLQPIVVRDLKDGHRLIAGWRRLMAHRYLKRTSIDAKIKKVKKEDEATIQLIENIHRKDLNPMTVAISLDAIRRDKNIKTQEGLAKYVGKSIGWISYHLKFLKVDPEVQTAIKNGEIGAGAARVLSSMPKGEQAGALGVARDEAKASGDVDKKTGKPKVKTKGVRRQSRRSKEAKRNKQSTIRPVAEREQEQKEEMVAKFFADVYGQKKASTSHKLVASQFWDFLMGERRLVIKS